VNDKLEKNFCKINTNNLIIICVFTYLKYCCATFRNVFFKANVEDIMTSLIPKQIKQIKSIPA